MRRVHHLVNSQSGQKQDHREVSGPNPTKVDQFMSNICTEVENQKKVVANVG